MRDPENAWVVDEVVQYPSRFTREEALLMIRALADWAVEYGFADEKPQPLEPDWDA